MNRRIARLSVTRLGLLALQLLLTAVVTWFIMRRVGLSADDLAGLDWSAWRPRWTTFLLSCGVLLVGYVASAAIWRWRKCPRPVSPPPMC